MVEYLYDAIRAVAGDDIVINAYATDENENVITENCYLLLHDQKGEEMLLRVEGVYQPEYLSWAFHIPAEDTKGLNGRYWYCVKHAEANLCFKQPIYLV